MASAVTRDAGPFRFFRVTHLVELTGIVARDLAELVAHLEEASEASVFHHTHNGLREHRFRELGTHNEFAQWVRRALQADPMAEQLEAVDPMEVPSLGDLRGELLACLRLGLENGQRRRRAPAGDVFHFCRSRSFVVPTELAARTPDELFEILPRVPASSLFYHVFESRFRHRRRENDIVRWLRRQGAAEIARRVAGLDPYLSGLDGLRDRMIQVGRTSL